MMKSHAAISLVQFEERKDSSDLISRMRTFFEEAKKAGSDLIAFPEYCLGRRIPVSHENVREFAGLAKEYSIYAVAGLIENSGSRWATTALMVDRGGILLGRYLKVHPAAGSGEHCWPPVAGYDDEARGILGTEFKVFHLDFAPVGILQCYDGYFPEAWGCTAYLGAEIILWINGRGSMVQDAYCITAAHAYGVVVGANISDGCNTGFAGPKVSCLTASGEREEMRLFPRIPGKGDGIVHASINLAELRRHRKHLRTMHQRRPQLYRRLTEEARYWEVYPDIPWDHPDCEKLVNLPHP